MLPLMKSRERVLVAIQHQEPDRVPAGELYIDPKLIQRAVTNRGQDDWDATREFLQLFELDLVVCHLGLSSFTSHSFSQIKRWAEETDFFVFALVGGGFSCLWPFLGSLPCLIAAQREPDIMRLWIKKMTELNTHLALSAVEAGADGIIIADDLAYNHGLFLPARDLRELLFPYLAEEVRGIRDYGVPVFFHSDGNINEILPDIVALGFNGLHCLQASAGMDLKKIKKEYGDQLCLMGTIDLSWILNPNDTAGVEEEIGVNIALGAPGGGFILSTCSGLTNGISLDTLEQLYRSALRYGRYVYAHKSMGNPKS